MMKDKLFILLLLLINTSFAQLSSYEINGYAKYLFSSSKLPNASERYDDHLIHARLNTRWYPTDNLRAVLEMRFRAYYGETVENMPNYINQIKGNYDYLNLDAVLWNEKSSIGYGEIDRLYLDQNFDKLQLTLGRQRIAWGTSWAWNPTDIFNPLSVLDFDYEERPAVDAVRIQYYTGAVSKIEFALAPAKKKEDIIAAGLLSINIWDYDFNFIGGIKSERWLAGAGWVGDIKGAGFRGELLVTQGKEITLPFSDEAFGSDNPIYSFVLSGDYTFPTSFYIHTEVLHNNVGVGNSTALFQQDALDLGLLTAAKWSVYQELAYDITPLMRGTIFGLFNPRDKSYVIVPSVTYSVITNLDLLFLGMFFNGNALTEYGDYGNTLFLRLKYSF
jgi:hypothetical protein